MKKPLVLHSIQISAAVEVFLRQASRRGTSHKFRAFRAAVSLEWQKSLTVQDFQAVIHQQPLNR